MPALFLDSPHINVHADVHVHVADEGPRLAARYIYNVYSPADGECGVAGCVPVGLIHKHQLVAGVREPHAQQLLKEPKHLNTEKTNHQTQRNTVKTNHL